MVCFIVWFIHDKKQLERFVERKIFRIKEASNKRLFVRFLIRFLTLTILYCILNHFFSFNLLLTPLIFWTVISFYFIIILISLFLEKKMIIKLLIILDIVFICIFFIQSICMLISSYMTISNDNNPIFYEILTISPLIISFSFFLIRDIKLIRQEVYEN